MRHLSIQEVNFVLIPEISFDLYGPRGFLKILRKRLEERHHAVIVVAEGAGQEFFEQAVMKKMHQAISSIRISAFILRRKYRKNLDAKDFLIQ